MAEGCEVSRGPLLRLGCGAALEGLVKGEALHYRHLSGEIRSPGGSPEGSIDAEEAGHKGHILCPGLGRGEVSRQRGASREGGARNSPTRLRARGLLEAQPRRGGGDAEERAEAAGARLGQGAEGRQVDAAEEEVRPARRG